MRRNLIRLDLFCDSVRDGTHDTPKPKLEGRYLVTSRAIKNNTIDFDNCYFISQKDFDKINKRSLVEKWDVLMTMIGTVGRLLLVKEKPDFAIKNIALFKVGDEIKAKWLYYYLSTPDVQRYFEMIANGTSQHFIGLGYMRKFKIPNITQSTGKIISILSAYDSLIENNTKRIRLLEQMAENLYKEWFVRFRFPGYENTEFVDGAPKGWMPLQIKDLTSLKSGFAFKSEWFTDEGYAVAKIKDIGSIIMNTSDFSYVSEENCKKAKQYKLVEGDLTIALTGATIGKVSIVPKYNKSLYTNQRLGKFYNGEKPIEKVPFLYCLFSQSAMTQNIVNLANSSSAQPNISPEQIENIKFVGNIEIIDHFNKTAKNMFNEILNLHYQSSLLAHQRDLLLPRLMSGKLEVKA